MSEGFISFCESLWQDWLADRLETSPFVRRAFDLDAAPEPYLSFGCGENPLFLLTTNPGGTMPQQQRAAVQAGRGPLSPAINYAAAAKALGAWYEQQLARCAAGRRIAAMQKLSALVGAEGVVQVEVCPFHSCSLPNKAELLREISRGGLLTRYVQEVRAFLITRPVVAISAASTRTPMESEMPLSPWATWLLEVSGQDPKRAKPVLLVTKREKITARALVSSQDGAPKALVQMMGGNHLPGEHGLDLLADALRHQSCQAG